MKSLELYKIKVTYYSSNTELEVSATNRFGVTFRTTLVNTKNHWQANSDFGECPKVTFKGILYWLDAKLNNEVRLYDERFFRFKRYTSNGEPMTWEQAKVFKIDNEPKPNFEGSLIIQRNIN